MLRTYVGLTSWTAMLALLFRDYLMPDFVINGWVAFVVILFCFSLTWTLILIESNVAINRRKD